jgi:hypothetical protein
MEGKSASCLQKLHRMTRVEFKGKGRKEARALFLP